MSCDDDDFRLRLGRIQDRGDARIGRRRAGSRSGRASTFNGQIQQAIRRAGGNPSRLGEAGKGGGRFNERGRGASVAAALKSRNAWSRLDRLRTRSRRVAVKARIVKLNPQRGAARGRQFVSAKAVDAHLRYLQRDGVTKDGEKGQVYSAGKDVEDGRAFVERGREDRHQFRFIVSAEEGVELSDHRATTRDLMKQMEADLGTRLDWIAVDHHNTGHSHTHIIVRGVTDDGKTLNIPATPIRTSNANGLTDAIRYQVYAPLTAGSKITVKASDPSVKAEVSPVIEGRATVKCTYNGKEKIYLIN